MKGFWSTEEIEYVQEKGLESDKLRELKWVEDQLKAVKGRELRRDGMWSVYNDSEVEWGVGLSEMFEIEYCTVCFTHLLVYLVVFNTYSSTLGSTRFWVLIVYNMCGGFFLYRDLSWMLYVILCAVCYYVWCVLLYCITMYCILLYHATTDYTPTCS